MAHATVANTATGRAVSSVARQRGSPPPGRCSAKPAGSNSSSEELTIIAVSELDARQATAWQRLVEDSSTVDVQQLDTPAIARVPDPYESLYVLAYSGSELLGGVMLLRRRVRDLGWIAYLPFGPVVTTTAATRRAVVLQRLAQRLVSLANQHIALFAGLPPALR